MGCICFERLNIYLSLYDGLVAMLQQDWKPSLHTTSKIAIHHTSS